MEGEGILYDQKGKKIYRGKFKADGYHGNNCFLYHPNHKVAYAGDFKNNLKYGKAKEWYSDGS